MASTMCGRPSDTLLIFCGGMPCSVRKRAVPPVACTLKPSAVSRRIVFDAPAACRRRAPRRRPCHPSATLAPRAELALGEGRLEGAIEADDLAGRAHFRPQHRVDAGEAREGKHRFLDADVAEFAPRLKSKVASRSPAMTRAAILAIGLPTTLATKGTVREARGLTSST